MNDSGSTAWVDRLLSDAGRAARWPATPDVRAHVLARLAEPRPVSRISARRAFAIALAAVALLVTALLASPGARTAVAEFFGLVEGYRIEVVPTVTPSGVVATAAFPTGTPTATSLDGVATRTTLEAAAAAAGFTPALPAGEAMPEVYLARFGATTFVVLRYEHFDLWQSREVVSGMTQKTLPADALVETATVRGRPGYWVSGSERTLRFVGADGRDVAGSVRTVGRNALVWAGPSRFYRLETDLARAEALRIANSLP